MKVVKTIIGDFTFDMAQKFRKALKLCPEGKAFKFKGEFYDPVFSKQIVEYLETQFDLKSEDE